jgi:hypothetical protein
LGSPSSSDIQSVSVALDMIDVLPAWDASRFPLRYFMRSRATIAREFASRALQYAALDKRLCAYTRFYGAAALTNSVFAEVFGRRVCCLWVSEVTLEFLTRLGRNLQHLNMRLASRIQGSLLDAEDLDRSMISIEQSAVQIQLERLRLKDLDRHAAIISQINRLIAVGSFRVTPTRLLLKEAPYGHILRVALGELGRALNFASQSDRECIARSLIRVLRVRTLNASHSQRYAEPPMRDSLDDYRRRSQGTAP